MKLLRTAEDLIECLEYDPKRVAEAMQRIGRFGGQIPGCNVLVHSLHVESLLHCAEPPETRLWALIHDVHEVLTGDVMRGWKPGQLDYMQYIIDEKIRDRFCPVDQDGRDVVDHYDEVAGDAEVERWGPVVIAHVDCWVMLWHALRDQIEGAK
jgi:hypothetical protein